MAGGREKIIPVLTIKKQEVVPIPVDTTPKADLSGLKKIKKVDPKKKKRRFVSSGSFQSTPSNVNYNAISDAISKSV